MSPRDMNGSQSEPLRHVLQAQALGRQFLVQRPWPKPALTLHAVRDVSINLAAGETLGIVGESGCGKSTLGRMLVGTLKPTSGSLCISGVDLAKLDPTAARKLMRDVQMVFQSPYASLNPRMRVGQIIREPLDIHEPQMSKSERKARVVDMLRQVGLAETFFDRFPHELSGGQQQRIGIARALVRQARIVVCDEPVSALDVSVQAQVVNLLRDLQQTLKVAYVFISHDLAVVANLATNIAVMYMGRIVEYGTAKDVLVNPRHPYTQALVDSSAIPDPRIERNRSHHILKGEIPKPTDPPSGCSFRTRCRLAADMCARELPQLTPRSGHPQDVACHYA